MIFGRLYCAEHPSHMCSDHPVTCRGIIVHNAQTKCFSSDSLSKKLYETPFLLTNETLPRLLVQISEHDEVEEIRRQTMALGHLVNTFPSLSGCMICLGICDFFRIYFHARGIRHNNAVFRLISSMNASPCDLPAAAIWQHSSSWLRHHRTASSRSDVSFFTGNGYTVAGQYPAERRGQIRSSG